MKRSLWRDRSFLIYLIGQTVSAFGDGLYLIAFMWLALEVSGGKGIVLGGVFSIYTLCEVVFGFIAGPIADRYNKKRILIIVDILRGAVVFLLYILITYRTITVFQLYLVTFAFSVLSPFFHRTEFTIIPFIVSPDDLLKANGILRGLRRTMLVIAPGLGGLLVSILGTRLGFLIDGGTFIFSSICIGFIVMRRLKRPEEAPRGRSLFADMREGYKYLLRSSFLLILAIYAAFINFLAGPVFPLFPLLSEQSALGASGYGMMMSALSAGLIASSFTIGFIERIFNKVSMIFLGLFISAVAIFFLGLGFYKFAIIGAVFVLGFGINTSNLPITTIFQQKVPEDKIGVVSSFVFTFAQIAQPISMALSGFLVDLFSISAIFITIGILLIAGAGVGSVLPQLRPEKI
ncbi:MAG TPA: MFS transporter [bacterium (Candidatus Stahlbacteria)]|nr:MFS transporter [Candidatus Stahlbacteria bacterium]